VVTIKYDSPLKVNIENDGEDGFKVHFNEDTLGFNPNKSDYGYSLTPDWNNRHFTLAFSEDSVLYHLTQEGTEEERHGEGDLSPEAFIADVYIAIRSLGPVVPTEQIEIDEVGKPDFDEIEEYLVDKNIISKTEHGVDINRKEKQKLVAAIDDEIGLKYEFYQRVLESVNIENAKESGESIFVVPGVEEVYILLFFQDGYVSVAEIREFYAMLESISGQRNDSSNSGLGSQVMHLLFKSLSIGE